MPSHPPEPLLTSDPPRPHPTHDALSVCYAFAAVAAAGTSAAALQLARGLAPLARLR